MKLNMKNNLWVTILICAGLCSPIWAQDPTPETENTPVTDTDENAIPQDAGLGTPEELAEKDFGNYPKPDSGYVTDLANLLTRDEEERIERWLWQAESRTNFEMAVVTIHSIKDYPGTDNRSIESFATGLFNTYGIGNMPENNGVLLLVSVSDRRARIELGAMYGRSSDGVATEIMNNTIVPYFKEEDYAGGITEGVKQCLLKFGGIRIGLNWPLIIITISIPIVLFITISLFRSGKRGWGWICVGLLITLLLFLFFIVRGALLHMPSSSSDSWGSGGFGGGFGGGFSGGGGATGGW